MERGFPMESTVVAEKVSMDPTTAMSECKYALTQYDQRFLPTYLEDCMKDPDLQSFDAKMEKHSKALIDTAEKDGGLSLGVLDGVVTTISDLGQEIANAVGNFKSQMTNMKDNSYVAVVHEYLDCSLAMLNLCTDMDKFLYEAREIHSLIEAQIQECLKLGMKAVIGREDAQKIVNILNNIRSSASKDHSAENLRVSLGILFKKHKKLVELVTRIEPLQEQEKKEETVPLKNKEESVPFWRKLTDYLYMGVKVVAVSLAVFFRDIASAIASKFRTDSATHWSCSLSQGIDTMTKGAINSLKEMGNFIHVITSIINDIDALLVMAGKQFATGIPVSVAFSHIKNMLTKFMKHICVLETKTENCASIISDARDKLTALM